MPKMNPEPSAVLALRLPPDLAARVRELARLEDRSVNSQILHLLKRALAADLTDHDPE